MKGSRGVGGHVFEENALTRHGVRGTEGSALRQNVAHDAQRRFFVEGEIDEARACDFHGGKQSRKPHVRLHGVHDHLRYVARVLLENFGALQRCGAREVAVLRVLRAIQARRHAFDADGFKGVTQEGGEGCFLFFNHFFLLTRVVERGRRRLSRVKIVIFGWAVGGKPHNISKETPYECLRRQNKA